MKMKILFAQMPFCLNLIMSRLLTPYDVTWPLGVKLKSFYFTNLILKTCFTEYFAILLIGTLDIGY